MESLKLIAVSRFLSIISGAALLVGCTAFGDDIVPLPPPSIRRVDPPVLNAEQQARQDEVDQFLAKSYHDAGWTILDTTQTYLGDIVDWLDPASVPGSEVTPPPPPEFELPPGVLSQQTEFDIYPELRGPAWSAPMLRPTFAPYVFGDVAATSLEDFLATAPHGRIDGKDRLYSGIGVVAPSVNTSAFINSYQGFVDKGSLNILEMAVSCDGSDPDTTKELIGVVVSQDRANFDKNGPDPAPMRLQVEFYTQGFNKFGNNIGGWHRPNVEGFKPVVGAPYPPGIALLPMSTVGGTIYDSRFEIRNVDGGWWISHNHQWLGYFPPDLFDVMTSEACQSSWYGEVFDSTPEDWTPTDMGSGQFAEKGLGQAAYFRLPTYLDNAGAPQWPDAASYFKDIDAACYTTSDMIVGGPLYERHFFLGGPGGDAPGCD